jgi:hypothetical protein
LKIKTFFLHFHVFRESNTDWKKKLFENLILNVINFSHENVLFCVLLVLVLSGRIMNTRRLHVRMIQMKTGKKKKILPCVWCERERGKTQTRFMLPYNSHFSLSLPLLLSVCLHLRQFKFNKLQNSLFRSLEKKIYCSAHGKSSGLMTIYLA